MNTDMQNLINSLGAIAEMCSLFSRDLTKQGFSETQALELTKTFLQSSLAMNTQKNEDGQT